MIFALGLICFISSSAKDFIEISEADDILQSCPINDEAFAISTKPATVSFTYKRSLEGLISPKYRFLLEPFKSWVIIVGIIALADCLGHMY